MAKRRDEMLQRAEILAANKKVEDKTFRAVKEFNVRLGTQIKARQDERGNPKDFVTTFICSAKVSGIPEPVVAELEVESGPNVGAMGEIEILAPMLREFLELCKSKWLAEHSAQNPLPPLVGDMHRGTGTRYPAKSEARRKAHANGLYDRAREKRKAEQENLNKPYTPPGQPQDMVEVVEAERPENEADDQSQEQGQEMAEGVSNG